MVLAVSVSVTVSAIRTKHFYFTIHSTMWKAYYSEIIYLCFINHICSCMTTDQIDQ